MNYFALALSPANARVIDKKILFLGKSIITFLISLQYPTIQFVQQSDLLTFCVPEPNYSHRKSMCKEKSPRWIIWCDSLRPINNLSVIKGWVFLGWTSTKLGLMCLAQGHNAVTPVRLEPAALRSRVKHSTTEPLCSPRWIMLTKLTGCRTSTFLYIKNSKWVWSGNTTITNCRQPQGTARKSHSTITRHQGDKLSKATSSLFPIKMIANAFYLYQIFALDSAVVEIQEMFSSHGSLLLF